MDYFRPQPPRELEFDTDRQLSARFVQESRFGVWFIGTDIWANHVLKRAIEDLDRLISNRRPSYPVIADFGCGFGRAFKMLNDGFRPVQIMGIDFDPEMLARSRQEAERHSLTIDLRRVSSSSLPLADQSVDMVFCHQTFHHVVDQREVLSEFHRVLKHDGLLLFAESTRKYIHSRIIRLLFCHPLDNQWSAPEYLAMIGDAGFEIRPGSVSYPYLWWSRSDFALLENLFGVTPPADREETLVNLVAIRD
jgi:ubiquinone/menaquinone biosynthesis C-methylase UbiE